MSTALFNDGGAAAASISSLGNILGTYMSNAQSYRQSGKLMEKQALLNYIYSQKYAKEGPSWQREGLIAAGYNPMLAVQNATSGANANWTGLNNSTAADYGNAISQGIANAQSFQRLENETKTAQSAANLQNQQAQTEQNKRQNLDFDSMMKDAQKHLTDKQTSWYDKKVNAEIYRDMQEAEQARAIASVQAYNAETARIGANAQKQSVAIDQEVQDIIRDKEKRYKDFGRRHPYLRNIDETLSRYFNGITAGVSKSSVNKH